MAEEIITCGNVDGKGLGCIYTKMEVHHGIGAVYCRVPGGGPMPDGSTAYKVPHDHPCHCPELRREALLAQLGQEDRDALERPCIDQPDDIFVVTALETVLPEFAHDDYIEFRKGYSRPGWRSLAHFLRAKMEAGLGCDNCGVSALAISLFVEDVERQAEQHMLKTGKLEGAHYRAMKDLSAKMLDPEKTKALRDAIETAALLAELPEGSAVVRAQYVDGWNVYIVGRGYSQIHPTLLDALRKAVEAWNEGQG